MSALLRLIFFGVVVRGVVLLVLGLNIRRHELIPKKGPAILVANHASHLDALVLMSLFPLRSLKQVRPVAAADYFLRTKLREWFATRIIRILPLSRSPRLSDGDPLAETSTFINGGGIVILFPEGTRSLSGEMAELKNGIAHLAKRHPDVPVIPLFMRGLNMALPKGEALLVPFFCDVFVAESVHWTGDKNSFMQLLHQRFDELMAEERRPDPDERIAAASG